MIDQATSTIIVGFVALSGSILVWALGNRATDRREARLRADEIRKKFLERQIEEFYGPLLAISRRINAIRDIRQKLIDGFGGEAHRNDEPVRKIRNFIRIQYYTPLYLSVENIVTNKLYLLDQTEIPASVKSF